MNEIESLTLHKKIVKIISEISLNNIRVRVSVMFDEELDIEVTIFEKNNNKNTFFCYYGWEELTVNDIRFYDLIEVIKNDSFKDVCNFVDHYWLGNKMTREIGDKLTDKNGLMVKMVAEPDEYDPCEGCFYNTDIIANMNCNPVRMDDRPFFSEVFDSTGCFDGGFIFVEDK